MWYSIDLQWSAAHFVLLNVWPLDQISTKRGILYVRYTQSQKDKPRISSTQRENPVLHATCIPCSTGKLGHWENISPQGYIAQLLHKWVSTCTVIPKWVGWIGASDCSAGHIKGSPTHPTKFSLWQKEGTFHIILVGGSLLSLHPSPSPGPCAVLQSLDGHRSARSWTLMFCSN